MRDLMADRTIVALSVILLLTVIYYLINIGNKYVDQDNRIPITRQRVLKVIALIGILVFLFIVFKRYPIIPRLISSIIAAIVISYIISPLVEMIEKRGLARPVAILAVYILLLGIIAVLIGAIFPMIFEQFKQLLTSLPSIITRTERMFNDLAVANVEGVSILKDLLLGLNQEISSFIEGFQKSALQKITEITYSVPIYLETLISVILAPVIAFHLLLDKEMFTNKATDFIVKRKWFPVLTVLRDIDQVLSMFIRGRLTMAAFVGLLTGVMLAILGIEYAIIIGLLTMVSDIIPYIGPFIALTPAVILALIQSPVKALIVVLFFIIIQWLENNVLGPKILGDSTGLHPLIVLLALIVGGGVAGFVGMIFSVPIMGALNVLIKHIGPIVKEKIDEFIAS